jgi:hypothetical protein
MHAFFSQRRKWISSCSFICNGSQEAFFFARMYQRSIILVLGSRLGVIEKKAAFFVPFHEDGYKAMYSFAHLHPLSKHLGG